MIKENVNLANKDPKNFQVILLTYHNKVDSNNRTTHEEVQRSPLTGTIDGIGHDVKRIKEIGISHFIFGFNFSPIRVDIYNIIAKTNSSQCLLDNKNNNVDELIIILDQAITHFIR